MNPLKWLINQFPPEEDNSAGWWIFRLPKDARWMERAAAIHDWEFSNASEKSLSQVDVEFFDRLHLLARNIAGTNYLLRAKMYKQICRYWWIARKVGPYFWDSPEKVFLGMPKEEKRIYELLKRVPGSAHEM